MEKPFPLISAAQRVHLQGQRWVAGTHWENLLSLSLPVFFFCTVVNSFVLSFLRT